MKLAKTLAISTIVAGSFAVAPAFAGSGFYGKVGAQLESISISGDTVPDQGVAVGDVNAAGHLRMSDVRNTPSRFGFKGSTTEGDMTAGVNIEYDLEQLGENQSPGMRKGEVYLKGGFGMVSVGQGSVATDGVLEVDHSVTWNAGYSTDGGFDSGDLGREKRIRYDRDVGAVKLAVSLAPEGGSAKVEESDTTPGLFVALPNDHQIDIAVTGGTQAGPADVQYAVGYTSFGGDPANGDTSVASNQLGLGVSAKFGMFNVAIAYASTAYADGDAVADADAAEARTFTYFKVGADLGANGKVGLGSGTIANDGGVKDFNHSLLQLNYERKMGAATVFAGYDTHGVNYEREDGTVVTDFSKTTITLGMSVAFGASDL